MIAVTCLLVERPGSTRRRLRVVAASRAAACLRALEKASRSGQRPGSTGWKGRSSTACPSSGTPGPFDEGGGGVLWSGGRCWAVPGLSRMPQHGRTRSSQVEPIVNWGCRISDYKMNFGHEAMTGSGANLSIPP